MHPPHLPPKTSSIELHRLWQRLKILLVIFVADGGEWQAVLNLVRAVKKFIPHVSFVLIGFGEKFPKGVYPFDRTFFIRQAVCGPPFSFFRKLWKDLFRLRQSVQNVYRLYSPDIILVTHYLVIFSLLTLSLRMTRKSIFLFHGIKGALRLEGKERNYRELCVLILERAGLLLYNAIITPSPAAELLIRSMLGVFGKKKNIFLWGIINTIYLICSALIISLIVWGLSKVNFPPLSHIIFIIFLGVYLRLIDAWIKAFIYLVIHSF